MSSKLHVPKGRISKRMGLSIAIILASILILLVGTLSGSFSKLSKLFTRDSSTAPPPLEQAADRFDDQIATIQQDSPELTTDDWNTYQNSQHSFTINYPNDWKVEQLDMSNTPSDISFEIAFKPQNKRYFREPKTYYPLRLQVISSGAEQVQALYPDRNSVTSSSIALGDIEGIATLREKGEVVFIFSHPNNPNISIALTDEIHAISEIGAEADSLHPIVNSMIASFSTHQTNSPE